MAIASEYPTTTDCMRSGLSPRLCAMAGSAVLTMVASSVCMKKPTATSHSNGMRDRSIPVGIGLAWAQKKAALVGRHATARGAASRTQTEKLEPQPQVVSALGFLMTNCAPCKSSL